MPKITFIHKDQSQDVMGEGGLSLMEIAVQNKVRGIEGACGGCLSCATCHVHVHPDWLDKTGERSEEEEDLLDTAFNVNDNSRLGCQITVDEGLDGLIVALPDAEADF